MSKIAIKVYHECEKPSMIVRLEVTQGLPRGLFLNKREPDRRVTFYERHEARWDCPACGSKWTYRPSWDENENGSWRADERTYKWVAQGGDWNSDEVVI